MHPAASIVVFTVATGAGYGLIAAVAVLVVLGVATPTLVASATLVGLGLATAGLLASTFHLGQPARAWRAFSQWRSSWLSREGIAAVAVYPAALALVWSAFTGRASVLAAVVAGALAVATVICTGMIYASLKPIPRWHNQWVVPGFLAFAIMTGVLWLLALAGALGTNVPGLASAGVAAVAVAALLKLAYWRHIDRPGGEPTVASATGLDGFGTVRLLDPPTPAPTYVMKEMGFQIARRHAAKLRRLTVAAAFAAPLALLAVGGDWVLTSIIAALSASLGALVERWLFFAEARHVAAFYYGVRPR